MKEDNVLIPDNSFISAMKAKLFDDGKFLEKEQKDRAGEVMHSVVGFVDGLVTHMWYWNNYVEVHADEYHDGGPDGEDMEPWRKRVENACMSQQPDIWSAHNLCDWRFGVMRYKYKRLTKSQQRSLQRIA